MGWFCGRTDLVDAWGARPAHSPGAPASATQPAGRRDPITAIDLPIDPFPHLFHTLTSPGFHHDRSLHLASRRRAAAYFHPARGHWNSRELAAVVHGHSADRRRYRLASRPPV